MEQTTPFDTTEEAWFWFMQAHQARKDGASLSNPLAVSRPCDPDDILKIIDRLYRHRQLDINHFRVLRHYGVRMMPPEINRPREQIAARLWAEALDVLGEVLIRKNIVRPSLSAEVIWFQSRKAAGVQTSW